MYKIQGENMESVHIEIGLGHTKAHNLLANVRPYSDNPLHFFIGNVAFKNIFIEVQYQNPGTESP